MKTLNLNQFLLLLLFSFLCLCVRGQEIVQTSNNNQKTPFFVINVSGEVSKELAIAKVSELKKEYKDVGYLWIPDYESLSGKEMYLVFLGPFIGIESCIEELNKYQQIDPKSYAVKVQHLKERFVIYNALNIKRNNKDVLQILTYSTPEADAIYEAEGGEDWGWFTYDVGEYFHNNYPNDVIFSSVFYGGLTEKQRLEIIKELGLDDTFGYVLIKGKFKTFIQHSPSNFVIQEACSFFNLEYIDPFKDE